MNRGLGYASWPPLGKVWTSFSKVRFRIPLQRTGLFASKSKMLPMHRILVNKQVHEEQSNKHRKIKQV
jgi:hypothetical protein